MKQQRDEPQAVPAQSPAQSPAVATAPVILLMDRRARVLVRERGQKAA